MSQPRRMTTSHVIGEALNLNPRANSFLNRRREIFIRSALRHITICEEHHVALGELDEELVARLGLTDAGLLRLAQKEEGTLLTDDSRLFEASDPKFKIMMTKHCLD